MPTMSAVHDATCKGRAPNTEARPSKIVCLDRDNQSLTATLLQHQHLTTRYGLRPGLAVIVAALLYQEPRR